MDDIRSNTTIQRYMNFYKLESLLLTKCLYVPKMSTFEDELEGGLSAGDFLEFTNDARLLDCALNGLWPAAQDDQNDSAVSSATLAPIRARTFHSIFGDMPSDEAINFFTRAREWIYVSCWHASPHECTAMWQLFGKKNSVCVTSSKEKLEAVANFHANEASHAIVSKVDYIDHFTKSTAGGELTPFLSKSLPYSFEREVRLIAWHHDTNPFLADTNPRKGICTLPLNPADFIETIIISPTADADFKTKIVRLCQEHGLEHLITPSMLQDKPILDLYAAMARLDPES